MLLKLDHMILSQLKIKFRIDRQYDHSRQTCIISYVMKSLLFSIESTLRKVNALAFSSFMTNIINFFVLSYLLLLIFCQVMTVSIEDILVINRQDSFVPRKSFLLSWSTLCIFFGWIFFYPFEFCWFLSWQIT